MLLHKSSLELSSHKRFKSSRTYGKAGLLHETRGTSAVVKGNSSSLLADYFGIVFDTDLVFDTGLLSQEDNDKWPFSRTTGISRHQKD